VVIETAASLAGVLLAVWTNDTAVDDDPGVTANLTLRGSADTLMGMDALAGFQQELNVSQAAGRLVVDDLVLRDYPILLRLIGWGS